MQRPLVERGVTRLVRDFLAGWVRSVEPTLIDGLRLWSDGSLVVAAELLAHGGECLVGEVAEVP